MTWRALLAMSLVAAPLVAQAPTEAAQKEAREILNEMIVMNTSIKRGDVTPLAQKIAARFIKAGVPAADVTVIGPEAKDKNLIVHLHGNGTGKPVLFLAHLDVVDALRTDWALEPFALTEKDGWLYGRGTSDDKGPAATLIAGFLALVRSKAVPSRDLILALTSGEEAADEPGAAWLLRTHKDLVNAEWVFNFDAGGPALQHGKVPWIEVQGAEKVYYTVTLTARNAGGHSSRPRADNAIYELMTGLRGLQMLNFPIDLTDVARAELQARLPFVPADEATAIRGAIKMPLDSDAVYRLARVDPSYNAMVHTTCVPTVLAAGHADNALPAEAVATVNCRIVPGEKATDVAAAIRKAVNDTGIKLAETSPAKPSPPSPLLPERLGLIKTASRATWGRDVPITPVQENGATDGLWFRNIGIPVYGVQGIAVGEDRMHGNDERIPAKSFREGVTFATVLIRETAGVKKPKS